MENNNSPALRARWSLNALTPQIKNKKEGARVDREKISAAARVLDQRQYKCCERGSGVDSWRVLYHVNP
jgi:hypothetical protein